ncbi:MAG: tRNA-dihydrouridine synthase family protein [Phycisphaerales bacterium]|nr:tRNA-dihydrouridine synthase family protein [Phycisphaerales bacterium]
MLRLGRLTIDVPFVQAALSGYSDVAMRRMSRRYGCQYALGGVVLDQTVLQGGKKRAQILNVADDDHPVGAQLMGALPEAFGPAAADLSDAGYDVIDINFGCPVRKVLGRCRGGFHLSQPPVALEIVRRVYDAVGDRRPVTVKMRRGMDDSPDSERHFFAILDGVFEIGASAVTVHGRSVAQRYVGPADWSFIARVKRHAGDGVILGSGDLYTAEDCMAMMRETGVDGVTIARGSIGQPWVFDECRALAAGLPWPDPPTVPGQGRIIREHFDECSAVYGPVIAPRLMRKFGIKYADHHPYRRSVRDAFCSASTPHDLRRILDEWYDSQVEWPPARRRNEPSQPGRSSPPTCAAAGVEDDVEP